MARQLVVIPLYNEQSTICAVIKELRRYYQGDVLIIDDGSTDCSPCYLQRLDQTNLRVLVHQQNLGYGASLIDGFCYALKNGYDTLVTMDCDLQHEPKYVPQLFNELGGCDVVSGSRYLNELANDTNAPPDRKVINKKITALINKLTDFRITDAFCGFKAYRVNALRNLTLDETGYAFPLQFWIQACAHDLCIKEIAVPRVYIDPNRTFGHGLDEPSVRLAHYRQVLKRELTRVNAQEYQLELEHKRLCA